MRLRKYNKPAQRLTRERIKIFAPIYLRNGLRALEALEEAGLATGNTLKANQNRAAFFAHHWLTQLYMTKFAEKLMDEAIGTVEQKRNMLWEIAQHTTERRALYDKEGTYLGEGMVDPKAATGAVGELNKMDGDHAAVKLHMKGDVKQKVIIKAFDGSKKLPEGGDEE